ncbi:MAG: cytochrome c biogenesis protein CcsA [Saprospiraceae bacterium]
MASLKSKYQLAWWKWLGVIIMLYVIIGGLAIPLNPGILSITPQNSRTGDTVLISVTGYNTNFLSEKKIDAYLKVDQYYGIKSLYSDALSDNSIHFAFAIPQQLPTNQKQVPASLIINSAVDGAFVLPEGLFIENKDIGRISDNELRQLPEKYFTNNAFRFPYRNILHETIRNTFFHVALWFAMFILLIFSVVYSVRFLITKDFDYDHKSSSYTKVAILYGILGIITGMIWAKFTWNTFWTNDVKLNMTAISILIYLAYLLLRTSINDEDKKANVSAVYNIFAFVALIPLVFVIPRMADSLHPGNGGNPALGGEDLDNTLRLFFYPSIIGLTLLGFWMTEILVRFQRLKHKIYLYHETNV